MKNQLIAGTKWRCIKKTYDYIVSNVYESNADGYLDGYYIYNQAWFIEHFEPTQVN